MATTPVEFKVPSGIVPTLKLYAYGSDTLANTGGDVGTEKTNNKGLYSASVTEALVGWYDAQIVDAGGATIANFAVYLRDTTAIHRCEEAPAKMYDGASEPQVDPIKWLGTALATPTVAGVPEVDMTHLSGDSTAADNAEQYFDGRGYGDILFRTTIATLASQTSFTLASGSSDDNFCNGCLVVVEDASQAAQKAVGIVGDYTGSTKTVTLLADPGIFTMAVGDIVTILADRSGSVDVSSIAGSADAATNLGALYSAGVANGTVAAVVGNGDFTLTSTDLTTNDDDYNNMILVFTSGNNRIVSRIVSNYTGATKGVEFTGTGYRGAFPRTVVAGDSWLLLAGSP